MLTFENFEQTIDPEILERGWQYHKSGKIRGLTNEGDGVWTARVKGTMTYDVTIEQASGGLETECTCPYDWGLYCKHVAAVLYAIREQSGGVVESTVRPAKSPKQKSKDKLRSILEALSREDLISILTQQFEKDEAFANLVLMQYSDDVPHKSVYAKRVRQSLKAGRGEYGYIDYWGASAAVKDIYEMLDEADSLLESGKANKTIPMLQAVVEGLVAIIEEADDSNGEIGSAIDETFERLQRAAEALSESDKKALLTYCLSEAFDEKYSGWDWRWDWLEVATKLIVSQQDRDDLFKALDRMAARREDSDFYTDYDKETATAVKLMVVQQYDGPEKTLKFLQQHQHMEGMRQQLVQYYIDQGNLAEAKKVCADAIWELEVHKGGHRYRNIYEQYLLAIAEQEGDSGEVQRVAKQMFVSSGDFRYYDMLKKAVPPAEWPQVVEELAKTVRKDRSDFLLDNFALPEIYAREGMWDRLLAVVKDNGVSLLERYRKQIEERYPGEACAIYEDAILDRQTRGYTGRREYQQISEYLSRMKRLGREMRVREIINELQAKYPKRRALMEELAKV